MKHINTLPIRNLRNNWEMRSVHDLSEDLTLEFLTNKRVSGDLLTSATAQKMEGGFAVHRFQLDYYAAVARTKPQRVTAKLVAEQHAAALANAETHIIAAKLHYKMA